MECEICGHWSSMCMEVHGESMILCWDCAMVFVPPKHKGELEQMMRGDVDPGWTLEEWV